VIRIAATMQINPTDMEAGAESNVKPEETSARVSVNRPRAEIRNER
jgi:hypothetical protein